MPVRAIVGTCVLSNRCAAMARTALPSRRPLPRRSSCDRIGLHCIFCTGLPYGSPGSGQHSLRECMTLLTNCSRISESAKPGWYRPQKSDNCADGVTGASTVFRSVSPDG
jgi:hypothetical protein